MASRSCKDSTHPKISGCNTLAEKEKQQVAPTPDANADFMSILGAQLDFQDGILDQVKVALKDADKDRVFALMQSFFTDGPGRK